MLVIGAHSLMSLRSDVLSGVTQGSLFGRFLLDQFGPRAYNVEVVHKYNMMEIKLIGSRIPRVRRHQFFCLSDIFCIVKLLQ